MSSVSVIIPAHRLDDWLDEAVMSTLESEGVDLEVIVVLNGVSMVEHRSWMESASVRVVHHPRPLGPTRAMIIGIEGARSDFIARLDADDRMRPTRLRAQLEYLKTHPETPIVGTAVSRISETGEPAGQIVAPAGDDVRRQLVLSNTVPHSSVLIRRVALEAIGGYEPALTQMEDYDVILRLAQLGPVAVLSQPLTEYRIHPGQISRGAEPSGVHIDRVLAQRRALGRVLGLTRVGVGARNALWRSVQFTRYWGVTRPGHEYGATRGRRGRGAADAEE